MCVHVVFFLSVLHSKFVSFGRPGRVNERESSVLRSSRFREFKYTYEFVLTLGAENKRIKISF